MRTEYDDVIRAWLDGAEVKQRLEGDKNWEPFSGDWILDGEWQYRIAKPAQKPKYLYVAVSKEKGEFDFSLRKDLIFASSHHKYVGKIRLEE